MIHSVNVTQQATGVSTPSTAESGLPFVVGVAPIQSAEHPASIGTPVLINSWEEAVDQLGYSDDWITYPLCEVMYMHFRCYKMKPVVFLNLLDPATMKSSEEDKSYAVSDHKAVLPIDVIISTVSVKNGSTSLTEDTDYTVYYSDGKCIIELIKTGGAYAATSLLVTYDYISTTAVNAAAIATAFDKVDLCITKLGVIPDLLFAPGFMNNPTVVAAAAAKAAAISGLCRAKVLVDLDCDSTTTYSAAVAKKATDGFTSPEEIVCWPMAKIGSRVFHMSTVLAGRIASTDSGNGNVPYESPSNKDVPIDAICLASGVGVDLTLEQANALNAAGIVTALNFMGGWVAWGNYTGAYPASQDVKDYFIADSRMFGWVGNTLVKTFWSRLDAPMNRNLIDSILDTCNIWLNGLVGQGYLHGARVEMIEAENPITNLMAGIIKLHVYMCTVSPMQELDFVLEYDASYLSTAFAE